MHKISNQYARCQLALRVGDVEHARVGTDAQTTMGPRRVMTYPFFTVFAIVVTANHYFLDAAGGAICSPRLRRRHAPHPPSPPRRPPPYPDAPTFPFSLQLCAAFRSQVQRDRLGREMSHPLTMLLRVIERLEALAEAHMAWPTARRGAQSN